MFTDMAGSTALAQSNEAEALRLRAEQEGLLRPLFGAHQGREIKSMGDGFLVEFDSALRATQCALEIQRRLRERNVDRGSTPILLRIGIHLGDVEQAGGDIFGDAVNIASRIQSIAEPGGICVSNAVREQVWNKISDRLEKLPPTTLKGLRVPIDIFRVAPPAAEGDPIEPTGIAVLPFANISPDPRDGYFADGLTEELISVLSQLPGLRVIARTSVMQYRSTEKPVSQIGTELGVSSVLEGSVRKAGNQLRITAQLIDTRSQGHLWSSSYDRELDNVFALQSEMAKHVAEALEIRLLAPERNRLDNRRLPRPESYLEYLQGRASMHNVTEAAMRAAVKHFERAIELDERNAAAHAGLADIHRLMGGTYRHLPKPEWEATSRRHAARAIELDPDLAEAHASLGLILWDDFEYPAASVEFELALSLNPSFAWARMLYADFLADEGRVEESLREFALAEQLDPLSALILGEEVSMLILAQRFEEAEAKLEKLGRLDSSGPGYHSGRYFLCFARGDPEGAFKEFELAVKQFPGDPTAVAARARHLAWVGSKDRARELLGPLELLPEPRRPDGAIASVYAMLGDLDACFRWLELAADAKDLGIRYWRTGAQFAHVRADPRFQLLLKKIHLA